MGRFEDKVVLVTGSSSGIGEATARAFDAEGASVVVNSASSVDAGEKVASELARATYVRADVSDAEASERLIHDTIDRFGRLDVLVNNAGVTEVIPHHDLDAVTDEIFRRIFEVNVLGTFRLTKLALPHLEAHGDGAVVNVTSVAGVRPTGSSVPYAVSKAALNHLTALLAKVTGPEVRVNAVAPGPIETALFQRFPDQFRADVPGLIPQGRMGTAEEVAALTAFLLSDEAPFITGAVYSIDGGELA
jgi:ketoreductase RED2